MLATGVHLSGHCHLTVQQLQAPSTVRPAARALASRPCALGDQVAVDWEGEPSTWTSNQPPGLVVPNPSVSNREANVTRGKGPHDLVKC